VVLARPLTSDHHALLAEEREVLGRLQRTLAALAVDTVQQDALAQSVRRLDELFLLVVVGEFNSGKSTFINALIGRKVLEEGATPTTRRVQLLKHGPELAHVAANGSMDVVQAPVDALRDIHVVDTPGTNAIFREHEAITADFVPRADFVLFVTSADRPFTETERTFMEAIREWGKKILIVINKADILETPEDLATVEQFVRRSAGALLGTDPAVFAVSARAAFRAKTSGNPVPTAESFAALEVYLADALHERERVRLKLRNPLGVGQRVIELVLAEQEGKQSLLEADALALDDIERQQAMYRDDMTREFRHRLASVDNVLNAFERRGIAFFDDTLRVGRLLDLLNKSRLKEEFTRDVIQDLPRQVEREVHDIIDWMVASDLRQWQGVMARIEARRGAHAGRLVGAVDSRFEYDRTRLLDTVGRAAERTVENYDQAREAETMAESVRTAVAGAALAEVGAIGLGAAVTALATTTFADVSGILAAGALAVVGLFVIPVRRRQAKAAMRDRIEAMRRQLMESITSQFEREVERSLDRVRDAISPYSRFVRSEHERLSTARLDLSSLRDAVIGLLRRVEQLGISHA
jgi:small GTP-binding protein